MKSALVTLSIRPDDLFVEANKTHQAYADKYGLEFVRIQSEKFGFRPNLIRKRRVGIHLEKLQIFELLDEFDRIMYLDSDTLVNSSCPNLLEIVPDNMFGCCHEQYSPDGWKFRQEIERMEKVCGNLNLENFEYFNAGVMVVSRMHQDVFKVSEKEIISGRWPDQTLLNYRILKGNWEVYGLSHRFNFLPYCPGFGNPAERRKNDIVHYAGKSTGSTMREDLGYYFNRWGI